MPSTVSHQENAIKNYKEVTVAYSLEKLASKGQVTNTAGMMGETGTASHCWWERKMVWLLWKTVWKFLRRLNK